MSRFIISGVKQRIHQLACALFLFLAGCATTGEDWSHRIGVYSYAEAIERMGLPENMVTHGEGSFTAEWLRLRGSTQYVRAFPYTGSRRGYRTPSPYHAHRMPSSYLRLTFDADEKLTRVEHIAR